MLVYQRVWSPLSKHKQINHQDAWQWLFENAEGFKGQSGIDHNGKVWKPEARAELGRVCSPKPGEKSREKLGKDQHRDPMKGLSEKNEWTCFHGYSSGFVNVEMEVSRVMGVPLNHHLFEWDFPWNKLSSYWDFPLWLWKPPNLGSHKNRQHSADLDANAQRVRLSDAARRTVPLKNPLLGVQFQSLQVVI